jgi:transcription-repair coupling factor (superfamily II helicase)
MKGESIADDVEIKVDITMDAHLPDDYVPSQDLRLEAYRRLATVRTSEELADIETEWRDRFGPLPEPAQALISVGALRVECLRLGITEIVTNGNTIRISPLKLRASQTMTLRRLASVAVYKDEPGFISLPVARGANPAVTVIALLRGLFDLADD